MNQRQRSFGRLHGETGSSFIVVLAALAIIGMIYLGYFSGNTVTTETKRAITRIEESKGFACATQRKQIERDLKIWESTHDGEEPSLEALQAFRIRIPKCPEDGTYELDGAQVRCSLHD